MPGWIKPGPRSYIATLQSSWRCSAVAIRGAPNMVLMAVGKARIIRSWQHRRPATAGTRLFRFYCSPPRFLKHKSRHPRTLLFCWGPGRKRRGKEEKKRVHLSRNHLQLKNKIAMRCRLRWSTPRWPNQANPAYPRMPREPRRSPGPRLRNVIRCATSKSSS